VSGQTSALPPVVLLKPIEPITVTLDVGKALIAGLTLKNMARVAEPGTAEIMREVGEQLVAHARAASQGAGTEVLK
jgi:hypothetical protein